MFNTLINIIFIMISDIVNFKIIVLGSQGKHLVTLGVGKSSMIMRYIKGEYA